MNSGMAKKPRVVLDSNIIISAVVYRGKPRQVLELAFEGNIQAYTSPILLAELTEVLTKKFLLSSEEINLIEQELKEVFEIVHPTKTFHLQKDEDDNRVLEAAVEGKCDFIVTGDKELLQLGSFRAIKIMDADQFLNIMKV